MLVSVIKFMQCKTDFNTNLMVFQNYFLLLAFLFMSSCDLQNKGLILSGIKDLSQLATTEIEIKKYVLGSQTKYVTIFKLNETKFGAESYASLKFGIDLSQIDPDDIKIVGKSITIRVPEIKLISFNYPIEKAKEDPYLSDRFKFANKLSAKKIDELFKGAQSQIGQSIPYLNIANTVIKNTENAMEGLVAKLGYNDVIINLETQQISIDKYFEQNTKVND